MKNVRHLETSGSDSQSRTIYFQDIHSPGFHDATYQGTLNFINLFPSFYVEVYKGDDLVETWKPTGADGSPYRRGVRVIIYESYDMIIFMTYNDV